MRIFVTVSRQIRTFDTQRRFLVSLFLVKNILASLALLLVFSGCGLTVKQKMSVVGFAGATRGFAGMVAKEFVQDRADVIEMNTWRVKLGDDTVNSNQMDGKLTVARVKERVDAIESLQNYADLLEKLATGSKETELKAAADSFTGTLGKVKGVNLSDKQLGVIGAAIEKVGGLVIGYMRAKAVREVIIATDPQIKQLLEVIKNDLSPEEEYWSLAYDHTVNALRSGAMIAEKEWDHKNEASMVIIREAHAVVDKNQTRFKAMSEQIRDVIEKLITAQDHLRFTIQSKDITTERINEYISQAKDCVRIYDILRQK